MDYYSGSADEGKRVQAELERQLREFGETVGDAFAHGLDGRGQDIGDAAVDVGRAAVNAANYGVSRAADAVRRGAQADGGTGTGAQSGHRLYYTSPDAKGTAQRRSPIDELRSSASARKAAGIVMMLIGGFMAFILGTSGLAALGAMSAFTPSGAVADIMFGSSFGVSIWSDIMYDFGSAALAAMGVTGGLLTAAAAGFCYMVYAGWQRVKAGRWLRRCADMADGGNMADGLSLELLKDDPGQKMRKALKRVRRYISKGWLTAWLDEPACRLYLTADAWRAAQQAKRRPKPEPEPEQPQQKSPASVEAVRRFVKVVEAERAIMRDEQGREELAHMGATGTSICDWLEAHPESLPKARRLAEYYIPTTLKLLHTYNDVQGQTGENAESIRRDISGILHTLNQAYDNLYNELLSDMALDVSGEIAALQGMLANDGLTGEGMR